MATEREAMVAVNARWWCRSSPDSVAVNENPSHRSGRNRNRGNDVKLVATLLAFAFISGCTTGSAVVTGQKRSPIDPVAVTLYDDPPADYEIVGAVEAASDVILISTETAQERAFAELKEQAAKIGANGVIGWEVGEITKLVSHYDPNAGTHYPGWQTTKTVSGTAIFVTSNSRSEK